jgi:hypothetical protein
MLLRSSSIGLLVLFLCSSAAMAQGGGGEKTTPVKKPTSDKETVKSTPKNVAPKAVTTAPKFRFDGAYQLVLTGDRNGEVFWIRFLQDGRVLCITTRAKDNAAETPKECLILMHEPSFKRSCLGSTGWYCGATLKVIDSNHFEFTSCNSSFTGSFQGNTLLLKGKGDPQFEGSRQVFPRI